MVVRIDCWSVVGDIRASDFNGTSYPPYFKVWREPHWCDDSHQVIKLCGDVINHPDHNNYTKVITSQIIDIEENIVVTKSETKYFLGDIDNIYMEWLLTRNSSEDTLNGSLCHIPTKDEPFRKFKLSNSY